MEQYPIEQGKRLQHLIKVLKVNQSEFAQSLAMSQPNISKLVRGESKLTAEVLNRITVRYKQVNLHWLLTGEGEMFMGEASEERTDVTRQEPKNVVVEKRGIFEGLEERIERLEKGMEEVWKRIDKLP